MPHIYVFSGLGADRRIFKNIDFGNNDVTFINWVPPLKDEVIEKYAARVSEMVTHHQPILIGLSFGGMMAIEVSKYLPGSRVILISSAKTKHEIPFYYRILGKLGVQRLLPSGYVKGTGSIVGWLFGTKNRSEKELIKTILKETDPVFLRWAMNEIVRWKNTRIPENLVHIHGTGDFILPLKYVTADHIVDGGTHLMVLNRSAKVSELLQQLT